MESYIFKERAFKDHHNYKYSPVVLTATFGSCITVRAIHYFNDYNYTITILYILVPHYIDMIQSM